MLEAEILLQSFFIPRFFSCWQCGCMNLKNQWPEFPTTPSHDVEFLTNEWACTSTHLFKMFSVLLCNYRGDEIFARNSCFTFRLARENFTRMYTVPTFKQSRAEIFFAAYIIGSCLNHGKNDESSIERTGCQKSFLSLPKHQQSRQSHQMKFN